LSHKKKGEKPQRTREATGDVRYQKERKEERNVIVREKEKGQTLYLKQGNGGWAVKKK